MSFFQNQKQNQRTGSITVSGLGIPAFMKNLFLEIQGLNEYFDLFLSCSIPVTLIPLIDTSIISFRNPARAAGDPGITFPMT